MENHDFNACVGSGTALSEGDTHTATKNTQNMNDLEKTRVLKYFLGLIMCLNASILILVGCLSQNGGMKINTT